MGSWIHDWFLDSRLVPEFTMGVQLGVLYCTTGMLLCSGVLCGMCGNSLLCAMLHGCAVPCCAMCACVLSSVCVAALCELLVRRACREALLCAALPYCAAFCSAVRWNGREMKEK